MFSNILSVITCIFSFVYTCYILCNLIYFLSYHGDTDKDINVLSDDKTVESALWSVLCNMLLLTIFIFQHSIMASEFVQQTFFKLNIEHLRRSIYNACSAASFHFLISKWQHTPAVTLWKIETFSDVTWMLFFSLHIFAWSIIYSGCIMMDIAELCGLKQVWYKICNRNNPLDTKSKELCRYIRHMRHPSLIGFFIILWIYPSMSMDRLLLSTILTIYMILMWTIDFEDYNYHIRYFKRKQIELS